MGQRRAEYATQYVHNKYIKVLAYNSDNKRRPLYPFTLVLT
jgi:hypothetical protein